MSDLSISNVINISVAEAGAGLGSYNTSNIAIFTRESKGGGFGSAGYKLYKSPTDVGVDFGTSAKTYDMATAIFSQKPNILANNGYLVVIPFLVDETLEAALIRSVGLVQYFGVMASEATSEADMLDAAAYLETVDKMGFFVSGTSADVEEDGKLDLLRQNNYSHSRGLFYTVGMDITPALKFMAAYAGRGLSVNFSGSNTTATMHLKDLTGVTADSGMTETLLAKCQAAGVDVYCSIQGVAKVFTSGQNSFFDDVYNLLWFVGQLKVEGFNTLAQTSTKIVQTENGVSTLKSAYRKVCEQGISNQFLAPGVWTRPETFGVQGDMFQNIEQRGYYIYSQPVSQQSASDRAARKAPLIQIAVKQAGAIHSSDVLVAVNA